MWASAEIYCFYKKVWIVNVKTPYDFSTMSEGE